MHDRKNNLEENRELSDNHNVCLPSLNNFRYKNYFAHVSLTASSMLSIFSFFNAGLLLGLASLANDEDSPQITKAGLGLGAVGIGSALYAGITFFAGTIRNEPREAAETSQLIQPITPKNQF